ncbi:MAG: hypothetical protein V4448_16480 [Pseudomonadota bacterium]
MKASEIWAIAKNDVKIFFEPFVMVGHLLKWLLQIVCNGRKFKDYEKK